LSDVIRTSLEIPDDGISPVPRRGSENLDNLSLGQRRCPPKPTALKKGCLAMAKLEQPTSNSNGSTIPFRERLGCSPREACAALGVGRTLLYELIAEGRIEVTKLRRRTVVSIPSLLKLLDAHAAQPKHRAGRPRKIGAVVAS
jgi:excisionase family DNA binding protein